MIILHMLVTHDESLPANFTTRCYPGADGSSTQIPLSIEANFAKCAFHNCANFEMDRSFVSIRCYPVCKPLFIIVHRAREAKSGGYEG